MSGSAFDSCRIDAEAPEKGDAEPLSKEIRFLGDSEEGLPGTLIRQALCEFVRPGRYPGRECVHGAQPGVSTAAVAISISPSSRTRRELADRGYTHSHTFFALPSFASPRWLFPATGTRCTRQGLQIYASFAGKARLMKALLAAAVATHCQALIPHRLLIASRNTLPLEDLVGELTAERRPVFSLLVGTEPRFRKLTVQVMRPDGEILGYIKLPLTEEAAERVRHEADTLLRLARFPSLRPHIPRVLHSGPWGQGAILFETAGPPRTGPVRLGREGEEFLRVLHSIRPVPRPGLALWEEAAATWQRVEPGLSSDWRALGHLALGKARRALEGITIACGVTHGDFAPWNTRLGEAGLFVFDWESATWEAPLQWDLFHFSTQVAALLQRNHDLYLSPDRNSGERPSFLLYLLVSACRLMGEASAARGAGLEFRRQLLAKQLGGY